MPLDASSPGLARHERGWVRVVAFVAVVGALAWLIVNQLLIGYFPLSWGGPNIGGGLLVGLCYIAVIGGLLTLWAARSRDFGRWSIHHWVGATAIVALLASFAAVTIIKPGDKEAGIVGRSAVTVTADGDPVLLLAICRGSVDRAWVSGPNRGDQPNERLAAYRSLEPVSGFADIDLLAPTPPWQAEPALAPDAVSDQRLLIASAFGEETALSQVSFTEAEFRTLTPGFVLDGNTPSAGPRSVDQFRAAACP